MNNKNDEEQEPRMPETLEEALMVIVYHSGVFFFKVALIVFLWIVIADFLRNALM